MTRVLLDRSVDRGAIERAANERGWPLLNILAQREGRPRQVIYGQAEWMITFVEDHRVDARYAVVAGHDPEGLAAMVEEALPTLSLDDVLAMLPHERARALAWLGVVAPGAGRDAEIGALLRSAAEDADAEPERLAARFALEALGAEG